MGTSEEEAERLAGEVQWLHWHLAFPDIFRERALYEADEDEARKWEGGFDVVLGNPPWERIKIQEKEIAEEIEDADIVIRFAQAQLARLRDQARVETDGELETAGESSRKMRYLLQKLDTVE